MADEQTQPTDHPSEEGHNHLSETTVLAGKEYPFPIYTIVFFALGALTILEVVLAEVFSSVETVKVPLLLAIATIKATLVVFFYMHLNHDSRLFALAFIVPVGIALLSLLYLLGVPTT
jgi:caa(3)-type oxidase subunit IV